MWGWAFVFLLVIDLLILGGWLFWKFFLSVNNCTSAGNMAGLFSPCCAGLGRSDSGMCTSS